jgi:iron complex outermembrane recepter protein
VFRGVTISDAYDAVGFTNYDRLPGTIPRWRGNFFVNYNHGWHNVRISTNYTDGATDNRGPVAVQTGPSGTVGTITPGAVCTVPNAQAGTAGAAQNCQLSNFGVTLPGFVSLDVTYQLSLPWDMTLSVSGFNLIGMDPPGARLPFSYDPFIGNPLGRTFKFGITQKF